MFVFGQFLISILVILCEYCLDLCISMALPEIIERLQMKSFMYMVQHKHRDMMQNKEKLLNQGQPSSEDTFQKDTSFEKKSISLSPQAR